MIGKIGKCIILLVFIVISGEYLHAEDDQRVIAMAPFKNASFNRGLDYLSTSIPEVLTTYLSSIEGVVIVERDQLDEILEEKLLALSGFGDSDSYDIIGEELSADSIIVGSFTTLGNYVRIDARLIDVSEVSVLGTYEVSGEIGKELENKISALAQKIKFSLTDEPYGTVSIFGTEDAQVILDGKLIGSLPISDRFLDVGYHSVVISKTGYQDKEATFEIEDGESLQLQYQLTKLPKLYQLSLGAGVYPYYLGSADRLKNKTGFYFNIEAYYKQVSLYASIGQLNYDYDYQITTPGGGMDTNSLFMGNMDVITSLRYYPLTGFISPFIGAGVSINTMYVFSATSSSGEVLTYSSQLEDLYGIEEQTVYTPVIELGNKFNLFDERITVLVATQFKLPFNFTLKSKEVSIFGDTTFTDESTQYDWFHLMLGVAYNFSW